VQDDDERSGDVYQPTTLVFWCSSMFSEFHTHLWKQ